MKWAVHSVDRKRGTSVRVAGGYERKAIAEQVAREMAQRPPRVMGADITYVVIRQLGN